MSDDTLLNSLYLGDLPKLPIIQTDLVGSIDPVDYYRFSLATAGAINISLTGLIADANLELIQDINNNGIVDAGEVLASSTLSGTSSDSINLNKQLAGGNYFIKVYQNSGDTNYVLRLAKGQPSNLIAEEVNFGQLKTRVITQTGFVGNNDTSDIYRFYLDRTSDINIALSGLSADANLRLIRDANNDGIMSSEDIIASSVAQNTTPDSINLNNQPSSTYFVQVYQKGGGNTNYTLNLSNNSDPSNLIANELNLGNIINNPRENSGFVGNNDTSDIYSFTLASQSDVNITLNQLSANANLRIIQDINNNGIVNPGEVIAFSTADDISSEVIRLNDQPSGNYFVQVYQSSGETNYHLRIDNNSLLIDQRNDNFSASLLQNFPYFAPMGQEFTPKLDTLNSVELWIDDWSSGSEEILFVNIREDSITGAIVGTSESLLISGNATSRQFIFPEIVSLEPDRLYVIELAIESGSYVGVGSSGGPNSTYPDGNQILWGQPQTGNDLWFRTGLIQESVNSLI